MADNSNTTRNIIAVCAIACAPLFAMAMTWIYWVSSSITTLKEKTAYYEGVQRKPLSISTVPNPKFDKQVSELADMTLPLESFLKKIGVNFGTDAHK